MLAEERQDNPNTPTYLYSHPTSSLRLFLEPTDAPGRAQEGESGGVHLHRAEGRCLFLGHRPRCQPLHMPHMPYNDSSPAC